MGRSLPASIPCQICGDKSYGRHYGLWTCDGCSCFFKRSVRRSITYTCISGDNKCPVDKTRRNWCPACRLRKCFEMQMNRNAVQKERGPRKRRCSSESIKTHTSSENLNEKDILLSKAIQKASESSVVMFLAQSQKCEILERFWAMFLAIYAAEQGNIVFNNEKINDLISFPNPEASVQKLDSEEVRLLSCLLFCKIGHQMESLKFAASLYDTYCFWLVRHCTVYYPTDPARAFRLCGFLQKILLCVEDFSSIHTEFSISPITIISQLIGK